MRLVISSAIHAALLGSALTLTPTAASAQADAGTYPSRPIRVVVPVAPGGANDILARTIGPLLTQAWGQQIIVDNRAGAGGTMGTNLVAKAKPDGYTLVLGSISHIVLAAKLHPDKPYDPQRDLAPITQLVNQPIVVAAHPSFPASNVQQLVALAKSKPGQLAIGSPGIGSAMHLGIELLQHRAGVQVVHVPYKGGGPATIDLVAGQVPALYVGLAPALPHIRSGRIKALAVAGAQRASVLPDVPTVAETLPGYEVNFWAGVLAPARTPPEIVNRLNAEIVRIINTPEVNKRLQDASFDVIASTPVQFGKTIAADTSRWIPVLRTAGVTLD